MSPRSFKVGGATNDVIFVDAKQKSSICVRFGGSCMSESDPDPSKSDFERTVTDVLDKSMFNNLVNEKAPLPRNEIVGGRIIDVIEVERKAFAPMEVILFGKIIEVRDSAQSKADSGISVSNVCERSSDDNRKVLANEKDPILLSFGTRQFKIIPAFKNVELPISIRFLGNFISAIFVQPENR